MKRNWNNMIARYNIYFNATQKLGAAVNNLAEKQKDDFEKYLNVYPYGSTYGRSNEKSFQGDSKQT